MGAMAEPTQPKPTAPLIARTEQVVLVVLALAVVAGVAWRAIDCWRIGAGPGGLQKGAAVHGRLPPVFHGFPGRLPASGPAW